MQISSHTVSLPSGQVVHFLKQGAGSPVVLMHGWGCNSSTVASVAAVAAENHTVYSLDLPGFGTPGVVEVLSPEPQEVWGTYDYARMLEEFVAAAGIDRPILIGHSYGGRVAIVYASSHPVERVVLVDSAGVKPRRSLACYWKVYTFKAAKFLAPILLGKEKGQELIEKWRNKKGSADYNSSTPKMKAVMSKSVIEDLCHLMPRISAPTLLLWGEKDTATPLRDARRMEELIPDSAVVSFPAAGHYSFLDAPAQFAAVLRSFLKQPRRDGHLCPS